MTLEARSPSMDPATTFSRATSNRRRSEALAARLEHGARALARFAESLDDDAWTARVPGDGRKIGVIVHHVASMYPLEVQLALTLAAGQPVEGVSWSDVHAMNARHAAEHDVVGRDETVALLRRNSAAAADAVRALTDAQLDRAAAVSLNANAPLTCQFFIEDHALRHSYHHLAGIRAALAALGDTPRAVRG
jgi:hypothetical protein